MKVTRDAALLAVKNGENADDVLAQVDSELMTVHTGLTFPMFTFFLTKYLFPIVLLIRCFIVRFHTGESDYNHEIEVHQTTDSIIRV
jgi:hypothetical protein